MKLFYSSLSYPFFPVEDLTLGRNSINASSELNVGPCPQGMSNSLAGTVGQGKEQT